MIDFLKPIPDTSWLHRWMRAWSYSEPPRAYVLVAGLAALSACIGRRCWLDQGVHRIWPMFNSLLIGPSGIGKSTSISFAVGAAAGVAKARKPQIINGPATAEKLHSDLAANPHALVIASELANMFNRAKYNEGLVPYVTELLDNSPAGVERRTRQDDVISIPAPQVTILGGSTPEWLQDQLPDSAGTGGFLARFLIVKEDRRWQRLPLPAMMLGKQVRAELDRDRQYCYREFQTLIADLGGMVSWEDYHVAGRYVDWCNNAPAPKGHLAPFASRSGEFVLRLCMLFALARGDKQITEVDVECATALYQYCFERLEAVVVAYSPRGKMLKQVLDLLEHGELDEAQLISKMKHSADAYEVKRLIASLVEGNDLRRTKSGTYRRTHGAI